MCLANPLQIIKIQTDKTLKHHAIFILSSGALEAALKIQNIYNDAKIYTTKRINDNDCLQVENFTQALQNSFINGEPIIALCATGIVIRSLAPYLKDKYIEAPVICVAEDGSTVIPLLGANAGANEIAKNIANLFETTPSITTSGNLRFGINLLYPPKDLKLINKQNAKVFISRLLEGETIELNGQHPWFSQSSLPFAANSDLKIMIDGTYNEFATNILYYQSITEVKSGSLTIVGLGPGDKKYLTKATTLALENASDILGYDYYIKLAGPFLSHQTIHPSDNRQELDRSEHALDLAASGKNVVIVSSGDPGIFAMAAAVMECLARDETNRWSTIDLIIEPGITAAHATAANIGAPLGHDFAMISLSDNLKPWNIIEKRIKSAIKCDLALALYNPVSKARPHQIDKVISIIKQNCEKDRIIIVATDVAREGQKTIITTIENLNVSDIHSRSILLVGSSQTKAFYQNKKHWVFTPRNYPDKI